MKFLLSWMTDPCVHLVVIGLLLFHFSMSFRANPDPAKEKEEIALCVRCDFVHGNHSPCSSYSAYDLSHGDR